MNPDKLNHPMQPIYIDEHGTARFKPNKIIEWLFGQGLLDLNKIAIAAQDKPGFSKGDRMQLAQLLGYSVSGFGDLSYADKKVVKEADKQVDILLKLEEIKKCQK